MLLKWPSRTDGSMTAVAWREMLASASTADEVISVARAFVASIDPTELAKLPAPCQPGKLLEPNDIASYAYELVRHQCEEDGAVAETIHKLAAFFSEASVRLSQIAAPNYVNAAVLKLFG